MVFGVAEGSVYAMVALGYTMVYGVLRMINFAHGEVFMTGAFASFWVANTLESSGFLNRNPVLSIAFLILVGMAVSAGVAVLLERVAYRPLRNAPRLVPLITAIGASLFLQNSGEFSGNFINFLLFISYWITPFVGVVLADWWLRGRKADASSIVNFSALPSGWVGLPPRGFLPE